MGGAQSGLDHKEVYESLRKKAKGKEGLSLSDLLTADVPELSKISSLAFLFRFDAGHDGTINFEEFKEIIKHLDSQQKERSRAASPMSPSPSRRGLGYNLRRLLLKKEAVQETPSPCWKTLDLKSAAELNLNRASATPAIVGRSYENVRNAAKASPAIVSPQPQKPTPSEAAWVEKDKVQTIKFLNRSLKAKQGRERFMDWLFKLADVDNNQSVSVEELGLVLKAIARDEINASQLTYASSSGDAMPTPFLSDTIMAEYDIGGTGYLDKDEFMVLADLIVRTYDKQFTNKKNYKTVDNYTLKWKLGEGSSGVVLLAVKKDPETKRSLGKYAIKIIPKGDQSDLTRVDNEIKAMLMLKQESIVKLEEVLEDEANVYFVMELCGGGSLADYVTIKPLSEKLCRTYFFQLCEAVIYCHSQGVCHRDLKLENLLLDNEGRLHVSDFGHAGIFQTGWDVFSTAVGSLLHLSPEQVSGQCYSGEKTDTWAMGVALYRMLVGQPPFFSSNAPQMLEAIKTASFTIPDTVSPEAQDLLRSLLLVDPDARIKLTDVLVHPWLAVKHSYNPRLLRHPLPVRASKVPWKEFVKVIRSKDVVCVNAMKSKPSPLCFAAVHCQFLSKDLKFRITLVEENPESAKVEDIPEGSYLEFALKEGESYAFKELTDKTLKWLLRLPSMSPEQ